MTDTPKKDSKVVPFKIRFGEKDRKVLEDLFSVRRTGIRFYPSLHGFMTAIAIGPTPIAQETWLRAVFGDTDSSLDPSTSAISSGFGILYFGCTPPSSALCAPRSTPFGSISPKSLARVMQPSPPTYGATASSRPHCSMSRTGAGCRSLSLN